MASILMRVTRASMLEVLRQDYITFAEAKGLSRTASSPPRAEERADPDGNRRRHRDRLAAGRQHDRRDGVRLARPRPAGGREHLRAQLPAVQAAVLFYAVTYVMLNFVADILYTVLNPRVKL
jgi:peptide/nickel transport system permease protein